MNIPASFSHELKQLSAALNRLNQRLQSESTPDPVVLLEFRQSLDNIRLTAWSASELLNAQRIKRDPDHVVAFLSAERLRRLDQLVRNLCGDIDRRVITGTNYGIDSLFDSVSALQQRLASCRGAEQRSEKEVSVAR